MHKGLLPPFECLIWEHNYVPLCRDRQGITFRCCTTLCIARDRQILYGNQWTAPLGIPRTRSYLCLFARGSPVTCLRLLLYPTHLRSGSKIKLSLRTGTRGVASVNAFWVHFSRSFLLVVALQDFYYYHILRLAAQRLSLTHNKSMSRATNHGTVLSSPIEFTVTKALARNHTCYFH